MPLKKSGRQIVFLLFLFAFATRLHAVSLMSSNDVATVIAQALTRAKVFVDDGAAYRDNAVVAVVDREGFVLGVWSVNPLDLGNLDDVVSLYDAITKAGTAAFLSSDQHAFSSRTAGFIVQQHFPAGIRNRPTGPLVGVNFSNMSFTDVNRFKNPHSGHVEDGTSGTNGAPVTILEANAISGLAGSPGGVPLFKDGHLIGGVAASVTRVIKAVSAAGSEPPIPMLDDIQLKAKQKYDVDEDVALAGQKGFEPSKSIFGSHVFVAGIRLAYVKSKTHLDSVAPLGSIGTATLPYEITDSPDVDYPKLDILSDGNPGEMRAPIIGDPMGGTIDGEARLTADEVTNIVMLAAARAKITRAGIRLPGGSRMQCFISVVSNPNQPGVSPTLLGTYRTPDATIFSWDVCVQKARTAVFFSDTNRAFSARTVGFLAQSLYPPGISRTSPGPFIGMQERFSLLPFITTILPRHAVTNILNGVFFTTNDLPNVVDPNVPNGITIFPGGIPLYRNGKLIGAIGVSGDGIDQDDIVTASGTANFLAPNNIRADHMIVRGARLPYAKFPRDPSR